MTQQNKDHIDEALFREFLRTKRLSFTYERKHILKEILEISRTIKHFSINGLHNNLRVKSTPISKSTLYRTIKLLEDSGIIKKTDIDSDRYVYEKVELYDIGHMVCLACKNIIEINKKTIRSLINQICRKRKFQYNTHVFEIKGTCHNCTGLPEIQ